MKKVSCNDCPEIATVRAVTEEGTLYLCEQHYQKRYATILKNSTVHNERRDTEEKK